MATKIFRPSKSPNLPIAPVEYTQQYLDQLSNALRLYFAQIDNFSSSVVDGGPFDYIDFIKDSLYISAEARLGWNSVDQTLNLGMAYGVTQQIGQETYARVKNETGVLIPNGTVVGFVGASSDALSVAPYLADGTEPSLYILGIMTHDLPDSGQKGYCTTWGFVRDLDTSSFSQGDVLYASPSVAGGLTNVKPTAPDNVIPVAACIVSDATNGVIFVRPTITQMQYYGEFSANTDQTVAVINTAYAVVFDTINIGNGITIGTPASRIVVPQSGLYRIQVSAQITSTSASAKTMRCWFRKNGVNIPETSRLSTSAINNGYVDLSHDITVSLEANEYIEFMYAADSVDIFFNATAATAYAPSATAVQLAITQSQQ